MSRPLLPGKIPSAVLGRMAVQKGLLRNLKRRLAVKIRQGRIDIQHDLVLAIEMQIGLLHLPGAVIVGRLRKAFGITRQGDLISDQL